MPPTGRLLAEFEQAAAVDLNWRAVLGNVYDSTASVPALHLAVFEEPYLTYVLEGRKTVESRFSIQPVAPYREVRRGDVVLLKRSSGPIIGSCRLGAVWFYHLDPVSWDEIRRCFSDALCAQDPSFWESRQQAAYATLMQLEDVQRREPLRIPKRDRRGWVVLLSHGDAQQLPLLV